MTPHEAIALGRERTSKLIAVAGAFFPRDVETTRRHDDWGVAGPAFVARSTRLAHALLELPDEHEPAAGVLLRVLYEHVTLFAWIAVDPPNNAPRWVRYDREQKLKAHNDAQAAFGLQLLKSEAKAAFEAERDAIADGLPGVPVLAKQADSHWSTRIQGFSTDLYGLRGLYLAVYRQFSPLVHGSTDSLHRIVAGGPRPGVVSVGIEAALKEFNAFTIAPLVYALGLFVSGVTLGFPSRQSVLDALV